MCARFCYWQAHYVNPPPCPSLHSIPGASSFKPLCRLGGKRPTTLATPSMTSVSLSVLIISSLPRSSTSIPQNKTWAPNFCYLSPPVQGKRWEAGSLGCCTRAVEYAVWFSVYNNHHPTERRGLHKFRRWREIDKNAFEMAEKKEEAKVERERHWTSR